MNHSPAVIACFAILLLPIGCDRSNKEEQPQEENSLGWTAPKEMLADLASAATIGEYSIHPPNGYTRQDSSPDPVMNSAAWMGKRRPDGTLPFIEVTVGARIGEDPADLQALMNGKIHRVKRNLQDWQESDGESGELRGIEFLRMKYSATDPELESQVSGFIYAGIDRGMLITIWSEDIEPHREKALSVADAAALTFTKQRPKDQ